MPDDVKKKILECVEELKTKDISILRNGTNDCGICKLLMCISLFSGVLLLLHIWLCKFIGFDLSIEAHKGYLLTFYIITLFALIVCGVGVLYIYHIHTISIFHKTNKLLNLLIWMGKNSENSN